MLAYTFFICSASDAIAARPSTPVVFLPGIFGSTLCERDGRTEVWMRKTPSLDDDFLDGNPELDQTSAATIGIFRDLELPPDRSTAYVACGLIGNISGYGGLYEALLSADMLPEKGYEPLVDRFRELGYEPILVKPRSGPIPVVTKREAFLFPYDWRQSNVASARALRSFLSRLPPGQKVDLVTHSMGGIVARLYLSEYDTDNRVRRLVTLGTPHWGAARPVSALFDNADWTMLEAIQAWFPDAAATVEAALYSFPAFFELAPALPGCCIELSNNRPFDALDIRLWYRQRSMPAPLRDPRTPKGAAFQRALQDARKVRDVLKRSLGGVDMRVIAARIHGTTQTVALRKDGQIVELPGEGDGTVPYASAINNRKTGSLRPEILLSQDTHMELGTSERTRASLSAALLDTPAPSNTFNRVPFGRFVPGGSGAVVVNFIDMVGDQVWASGKKVSIDVTADFSLMEREQPSDFSNAAETARKFVGEQLRGSGACIRRLNFCLTVATLRAERHGTDYTRHRLTLRFEGTAPVAPGIFELRLEQSLLPEIKFSKWIGIK